MEKVISSQILQNLLSDPFKPGECHEVSTGTCSLNKKMYNIAVSGYDNSALEYCQMLHIGFEVCAVIESIQYQYEFDSITEDEYINMIFNYVKDSSVNIGLNFAGVPKEVKPVILETCKQIQSSILQIIDKYYDVERIDEMVINKYLQLGLLLSSKSKNKDYPSISGNIVLGGRHRVCIALRSGYDLRVIES